MVDAHVGDTAVAIAIAGAALRVVHASQRGLEEPQVRLRRAKVYRHLTNDTSGRDLSVSKGKPLRKNKTT